MQVPYLLLAITSTITLNPIERRSSTKRSPTHYFFSQAIAISHGTIACIFAPATKTYPRTLYQE
ncbi:hypothetical protein [Myxosarcina sp. GI1]|uniref:hypothetical protein n=1 Tax=Myxosarcina sp. GI1 TaxID=1541065 RepID=UPI00155A18D5|nr:hypothetical protein [Myxosarcina sp. GI1]